MPLVALDEIHKDRRWKRNLKGVFDTLERPCDILVTGSARLNVYMKGSDSLLGRHFSFRLHPFTMRERVKADVLGPDEMLQALFSRGRRRARSDEQRLAALMTYGPFPEPLLAQDVRKARLWRRNREQLIVREDLRDLTRLLELGRIEMLTAILPERVGSLFSFSSVARDLEVSVPTAQRWVRHLEALYHLFEIKPWSKRIARSLRKEGKVYLWDYAGIKDKAVRFENLVASHLLKICHYWTDTGEGEFELRFLRTKEKHEIDFLIVRDGKPWLPIEVKSSDTNVSRNWRRFEPFLPCKYGLQLVSQPWWETHRHRSSEILVAGTQRRGGVPAVAPSAARRRTFGTPGAGI